MRNIDFIAVLSVFAVKNPIPNPSLEREGDYIEFQSIDLQHLDGVFLLSSGPDNQ